MIFWTGLTCCFSAAVLYHLGRISGKDAEVLKSVNLVSQLKDLAHFLEAANKVLPFIVTISGRVGSDTPINCEHSALRGVIVEETTEEHFLKHDSIGSWIKKSAIISSLRKEVPWYLDDGSTRVFVVRARTAAGLVLTVASEVFEESRHTLVRRILDYLRGHKILGVRRTERVLPTGTSLTVVGEAIKDDNGTVRIQRPLKGPFYVSHKHIDQLIAKSGKWTRLYNHAAIRLAAFGLFLIAEPTFQFIMEINNNWESKKRVLDAAANRTTTDNEENGVNGNLNNEQRPDICVICFEQEYDALFVPCGHMCSCWTCSWHLRSCPLCRCPAEKVLKTSSFTNWLMVES